MKYIPQHPRSVLLASIFAVSAVGANAADVTWNVLTGQFSLNTNWNPQTVPTTGDHAIINNGGTATIQIGDIFSVNQLSVSGGSILTQTGGSMATGTVASPAGAYDIGGVSGQTGTYNVSGGSSLTGGRVRIGQNGGTGSMTVTDSTYVGNTGQTPGSATAPAAWALSLSRAPLRGL